MKENTIELIRTLLSSDETVSQELADSILRLCRKPVVRRSLIGAKKVMDILQISRPTLRAYVKSGTLTQINYSPRKVRFDEDEVYNFLYSGAIKDESSV